MIDMRSLAALALLLTAGAGCSSSTVPAHDLDATLVVDGVETHAVLSFPDHDAAAHHAASDSHFSLFSGNCGADSSTEAKVSGDAPIAHAYMHSLSDGTSVTYDIDVTRAADDAENVQRIGAPPTSDYAMCRIYDSELGKTKPCYYTAKKTTITLRAR